MLYYSTIHEVQGRYKLYKNKKILIRTKII